MAKYNSIGSYEATSVIPQFTGLMQYGDGINTAPIYALEEKNVETKGGVLQPAAACTMLEPYFASTTIGTLARLYRRWYTGQDSKEILVAASGGKLYYMHPTDSAWTQLAMPTGVTSYSTDVWSWVTYEYNPPMADYDATAAYAVGDFCLNNSKTWRCKTAIATGGEAWNAEHWDEVSYSSIDVLLLSNATDGMIMLRGDIMTVSIVETPEKFGVIERYAERIWGGAITDNPDMLVYSAPFDPTDWKARSEDPDPDDPWQEQGEPEDGAGDISQPSWDGDSFTALRAFGSQLIAFKRTRVWRIMGTDPGEYTFKEQYGGGAPYEGTIAVDNEQILMMSALGPQTYDGMSVSPFQQEYCRAVWNSMNKNQLDKCAAVLWRHKYYVAIPTGNSTVNNAVVIYNPMDGSWLLRDDLSVERWLGTEDKLYFTSSTTPGRLWEWKEDSWETGSCTSAATRWVSPWNDLSNRTIVKGGFEVYFLCEVKNTAVPLKISIQTEKKIKTKTFVVQPLTATDLAVPKNHKQKRLHFGGSGRRFRLIIETDAGAACWRLVGGVLIKSELDPD